MVFKLKRIILKKLTRLADVEQRYAGQEKRQNPWQDRRQYLGQNSRKIEPPYPGQDRRQYPWQDRRQSKPDDTL
jgi:hypothetical protein